MGGDVAGPRHQVVIEVDGAVTAVGVIGFGRLPQGVAHAHPGAADELLLDELRVERAADLVGRLHVAYHDFAGLIVDLDLDEQGCMGKTGHGRHLAGFGIHLRQRDEEDAAPRDRAALLELGGLAGRHGGDRSGRRTVDVDVAAAVGDEVGGVDFQFLGGRFQHHGARFLRGLDNRVADPVRAARCERAHAVRAGVAVGGVDIDIGHGNAEGLGRDLAGDGLHALAEIDRRQRDGELAVGIGVDERLGRIAAEVHADRIVDCRKSAATVQAHQRLLKPEIEENRMAPWRGRLSSAGAGRGGSGADAAVDAAAGSGRRLRGARPALAAAGIV